VICHNDKVATPLQLRTHVVKWHHKMSCHPGERRAKETMRQHLINVARIKNRRAEMRLKMSKLPERQQTKEKTRTHAPKNS
jgi:hypothetical protein